MDIGAEQTLAEERRNATSRRWTVPAIMAATVGSVFPGFLIGALAVQVSADLGVVESAYGWGVGGFFLAAALGSVALGRRAQRVGPRRQILAGLFVTLVAELFIATLAPSWWWIVAALAVAGFVNSGTQSAVNLALTQAAVPRLGLAIALKQSAMPIAAMLGGLAVPALALTLGWRWAYAVGALVSGFAVVAVALTLSDRALVRAEVNAAQVGSSSSRPDLILAALAAGCLAFAAGALTAWVVSSGVHAGLGEATAGVMLSVGSATGVTLRIIIGVRLDRMTARPFLVAGLIVVVGVVGVVLLAVGTPHLHMFATLIAFAGGWVWPVFTNYAIVRANPATAARATGITQTGVYVGVFLAPLVTGAIIQQHDYRAMWLSVACVMALGSTLAISLRNRF